MGLAKADMDRLFAILQRRKDKLSRKTQMSYGSHPHEPHGTESVFFQPIPRDLAPEIAREVVTYVFPLVEAQIEARSPTLTIQ